MHFPGTMLWIHIIVLSWCGVDGKFKYKQFTLFNSKSDNSELLHESDLNSYVCKGP